MARRNPSDTESLKALVETGMSDDIEDFYSGDPEGIRLLGNAVRHGSRVEWVGYKGKLIRIDPEYTRSIEGNIFDREKLSAISKSVMEAGRARREHPVLFVGYGSVSLIDDTAIKEDQDYFKYREIKPDRPLDDRDKGKLMYTIRDGNHRVFGSLIGGERDVWIHLAANDLQSVDEYREAKKKRKLKEFTKSHGPRWVKLLSMLDAKLKND